MAEKKEWWPSSRGRARRRGRRIILIRFRLFLHSGFTVLPPDPLRLGSDERRHDYDCAISERSCILHWAAYPGVTCYKCSRKAQLANLLFYTTILGGYHWILNSIILSTRTTALTSMLKKIMGRGGICAFLGTPRDWHEEGRRFFCWLVQSILAFSFRGIMIMADTASGGFSFERIVHLPEEMTLLICDHDEQ